MVSKILAFLDSDQDQLLGIHGMGGVGKTTLLGELNRRLKQSNSLGFDLVICVEVKRKVDIFRIQEDVGWRLGYSRSGEDGPRLPADIRDRAKLLARRVSEKKCLLILDDVWEKLDLGMIGFPPVISSKCKVVLTTRDERVCIDMDVHKKLRLNFLNAGDSWTLFRGTIRNDDLLNQEEIRSLAKTVVGKCGGLPVVIVTVARAMADKESVQEWEDARDALDDFPGEIRGMTDVLERLKFSFDNLKERERSCFLYCAMFPEGEEIPMGELVEYWIGDELVDVDRHCYLIDRFRNRGRSIVTALRAACLLERGSDDEHVRMHDTVRDMALWIGEGSGERKIVALAGKGLAEAIIDEAWIGAEMASLMSNGIDKVIVARDMNKDSSLRSLLISRNIRLENLPEDLFVSMVALRVLDLSETSVINLPKSVFSLRSIRFLNLSQTWIEALPLEIGELTNLKQLDLSYTPDLKFIPLAAISCLSKLQSLNLFASSLLRSEQEGNLKLQDLEAMLRLNDLGLRIEVDKPSNALAILLNSNRLLGSTRLLEMWRPRAITSADNLSSIGRRLTRLQKLEILHCDQVQGDLVLTGEHFQSLERWKADDLPITSIHVTACLPRLRELHVSACHGLMDFACLWRLPRLRRLRLHCCHGITELLPIVAGECSEVSLSRALEYVDLRDLPAMVSVSRVAVAMPSLAELWVYGCPEVVKLPVVPDGGKKVRVVCEEEWWEALEWEGGGGGMKGRFDPSFFDKSWKAARNAGF